MKNKIIVSSVFLIIVLVGLFVVVFRKDLFINAGNLIDARTDHSAILIKNDKILVFGGYGLKGASDSIELYNPKSKNSKKIANLPFSLIGYKSVLLNSGKILITGGQKVKNSVFGTNTSIAFSNIPISNIEVIDPDTGKVISSGSMVNPREYHTATLLKNGKILITGGQTIARDSNITASAELYDPTTCKSLLIGNMNFPHSFHIAILMQNGKVLILGRKNAELYDPNKNIFIPLSNMINEDNAKAVIMNDGRVLLLGELKSEIFDPQTNKFSPSGNMLEKRSSYTVTVLPNNKILIAGGNHPYMWAFYTLSSIEVYDPITKTFSKWGEMSERRSGHTATLLSNNKIVVLGGTQTRKGVSSKAEFLRWKYFNF